MHRYEQLYAADQSRPKGFWLSSALQIARLEAANTFSYVRARQLLEVPDRFDDDFAEELKSLST